MKITQFTETQIVSMLKQHEQGIKVSDIARSNGVSFPKFRPIESRMLARTLRGSLP